MLIIVMVVMFVIGMNVGLFSVFDNQNIMQAHAKYVLQLPVAGK